jgi:hypothetical protein
VDRIDTFTIPEGRRRRVYRPCDNLGAKRGAVSIQNLCRIFADSARVNFRQTRTVANRRHVPTADDCCRATDIVKPPVRFP